ncbi:MAG: sugar O-acetyltransferase, partial [Oscillospiraceae bacterium]|nr:sugar O-acetyltransferase [Oscillospiraceae bacterium]
MTEAEKATAGYLYDANYDAALMERRNKCKDLCYEFNACRPSDEAKQQELIRRIIGEVRGAAVLTAPFWCDYGDNISLGNNFYANHNCIILDGAKVTFGDNVFIAPNCCFSTAGHPFDVEQRNAGLEIALPITVGNNVWFGAGVTVVPGVTIGDNAIIGAGSIVTRDIPPNVIAVGNPCKVVRP